MNYKDLPVVFLFFFANSGSQMLLAFKSSQNSEHHSYIKNLKSETYLRLKEIPT